MPSESHDPATLQEFRVAPATRDPKTVATYLTTMRDFVAWLATKPGGTPFHVGLVTETAVRGYMDSLQSAGRAPRTCSKALCEKATNALDKRGSAQCPSDTNSRVK